MTDDRLIGWLCIMRHNLSNGGLGSLNEDGLCHGKFCIPPDVRNALVARGWMDAYLDEPVPGQSQTGSVTITRAGHLVSDLAAPDWGIDPIPEMA